MERDIKMWIYKGNELGSEGITGIPNRDMTDEEFREAAGKLGIHYRQLAETGLWESDERESRSSRRSLQSVTNTEEEKDKEKSNTSSSESEGVNDGSVSNN